MAATCTWTGTTSGDFNVTTNWLDGAVPVSGDSIVFDRGTRDLDTNVNLSTTNFAKVSILSGYTGRIGNSTSDPFYFGTQLLVIDGGGGNVGYIKGGASTSYDIEKVVVKGYGPDRARTLYLLGTLVDVIIYQGSVVLDSGTAARVITKPRAGLGTINVDNSTCVITALTMYGGNARQISTGTITTARIEGNSYLKQSAGTVTNTYIGPGSTHEWSASATIAAAYVYGKLDCSKYATGRTLTASELHDGGMIYDPYAAITFTAAATQYGGVIQRQSVDSSVVNVA